MACGVSICALSPEALHTKSPLDREWPEAEPPWLGKCPSAVLPQGARAQLGSTRHAPRTNLEQLNAATLGQVRPLQAGPHFPISGLGNTDFSNRHLATPLAGSAATSLSL